MTINVIGYSGTVQEVDATFAAARASLRPPDYLNFSKIQTRTGLTNSLAANAVVYSFRNPGKNPIAITSVSMSIQISSSFATNESLIFNLIKATQWITADTAQTLIVTRNGQNKMREDMPNILFAPEIRVSNTGAITAGSRTLQTQPMAQIVLTGGAKGVDDGKKAFFFESGAGETPLILAGQEGFVITTGTAPAVAGDFFINTQVSYAEMAE